MYRINNVQESRVFFTFVLFVLFAAAMARRLISLHVAFVLLAAKDEVHHKDLASKRIITNRGDMSRHIERRVESCADDTDR